MNLRPVDILLVEDNPHDIELTLHAFKKNNINNPIHVARDGAEALDYVFCTGEYAARDFSKPPKVILLDLKMPKVDGLEVLQKIKGDERTKKIPVVVMTSSRLEQDVLDSYQLGVNSYIVKPVDFEKFSSAVTQLGCYWMLLNQAPE